MLKVLLPRRKTALGNYEITTPYDAVRSMATVLTYSADDGTDDWYMCTCAWSDGEGDKKGTLQALMDYLRIRAEQRGWYQLC